MPYGKFTEHGGEVTTTRLDTGKKITFHTSSKAEAHRRAAIRENYSKYGQAFKPSGRSGLRINSKKG